MKVKFCAIVKNEERVIARCLRSVKPFVDSWCICDTGSTDRTKEIILEELTGIPGELHDRPWLDFGHNRTDLLTLARMNTPSDWLFMIDSDEEAQFGSNFFWPEIPERVGACHLQFKPVDEEALIFQRPALFRTNLPFYYHGVIHEQLECNVPFDMGLLLEPLILVRTEGSRDRSGDEGILKKAWMDTHESFYLFYLAQELLDKEKYMDAQACYHQYLELEPIGVYANYSRAALRRIEDEIMPQHDTKE